MKNKFLSHTWMVLAGLFFSAIFGLESKASSIARTVTIVESQTIAITLEATPDSAVFVYAVEESVSSGVTAINISDGGSYDAANSLIKWGPWFDAQTRVLSYELEVSDNITTGTFPGGQGSFDGVNIAINGEVRWDAGETEPTQGSSRVVRSIASAGGSLLVKLEVSPESTVFVHAVEDGLPSGLVPSNINEGGSFDAANGLIKWGPWFDAQTRMLSYELDPTGLGNATFPGGQGSFDGINISIGGESSVDLGGGGSSVNQAPIAQDASFSVVGGQTLSLSLTANDPDGDSLTYTLVSNPTHGTLTSSGPSRIYTPNDGFSGADSFTFRANDGTDDSNLATINIEITEAFNGGSKVNRTFSVVGSTLLVKLEVSPESTVFVHAVEDGLPSGLVPSNINEGGSFDAANGLIKWGPWFDAQTRMLSYELDVSGQASFTLPGGKGSFDGVNVLIEGDLQYPHTPNNPPIAFGAVIKVESGKSSGALLYGYDPDEDDYQIIIQSEPTHGSLNLDDLPVVLYTPYANYVGEDSFRFILTDGTDFSEPATVGVFVTEPEKPKGIDSITRLPSGKLVIEFTGTLKSTKSLRDPFLPVDGAESPLITPATDAAMFFSAD
ncbi:Ig-like domain-containing protein [Verrucomicrobia bacterium]|nr:Ig-like domain-containing protein [Verrucomicrobiota bacterium]